MKAQNMQPRMWGPNSNDSIRIGFAGPDGKNYVLEDETLILSDENGIINAVLPDVEDKVELAVTKRWIFEA